jgi:Spy/CpxP family protein refolding chaperone
MRFSRVGPLLGVLLILSGIAAPVGAQSFAWWKSEQFQKDLGLTSDQATRIDNLFQATLPRLRQDKEELDRQEAELSNQIEAGLDEVQVTKQVDKVEATRAHLNKTRTLMLLHMRQVLTPDQRVKFKALHEQWEKARHQAQPAHPNGGSSPQL